jgi:hypothetical protein
MSVPILRRLRNAEFDYLYVPAVKKSQFWTTTSKTSIPTMECATGSTPRTISTYMTPSDETDQHKIMNIQGPVYYL